MPRVLMRALIAAGLGAFAGALLLVLAYPPNSSVVFEMDRDAPSFLTGTYPVERDGQRTFVWTSRRVVLRLAGLDRRVDWTCTLHVRGARDATLPQPDITLAFDGAGAAATRLGNEFQDVTVTVPARPGRPGLTLTADIAPTFRPGASDPRELGAQLDWLRCAAAGRPRPPAGALHAAAIGAAALGAAGALISAPMALVIATVLMAAAGYSLLLSTGGGAFGPYPTLVITLTVAASVVLGLLAWAPVLVRRPRLTGGALAAVTISAVFAVLKLAALSHPAKPLIDAVFQAHRLEWVMAGRYFFTQPMPSGVEFPYAIGLYVTAAPLAVFIADHVLLLRLVVILVEATGGLLLYAVIARGFQDRAAGLVSVVLYHLVPLTYVVVGNANLTNAFAQGVGTLAVCGLALMPAPSRSARAIAAAVGVGLLTSLAFLSHVGTIVLVAGIFALVVVTLLLARRQELSRLAGFVVVMTTLAGVLAVGVYYRHFTDVYARAIERVRAPETATVAPPPPPREGAPAILVRPLTWRERAANSGVQTLADLGWPILTLGAIGVVARIRGRRERVPLLLLAWAGAWLIFLTVSTLTRVEVQFQRYAAEFVARVNLAAYPALVAAAGLGATALWRRGRAAGALSIVLLGAAAVTGVTGWLGWFE
jgi:hypothetical protein